MAQKLITKPLRAQLLKNGEEGQRTGETPPPIVKLFVPWGAGTWLVSEAMEDEDEYGRPDLILFALADLGTDTPELGSVRLSELERIRGPWGMKIERDIHWSNKTQKSMEAFMTEAREAGRINA